MKKLLIVVMSLLVFIPNVVFASTDVKTRTDEDLKVSKDIIITEERYSDIMKTPSVNSSEKIYDYADLFDKTEEEKLFNLVDNFITLNNTDLLVVTINDNPFTSDYDDYESTQEYADNFYDYNDFGIGDEYDGIIVLCDMDNRIIYIGVTGNARYYISDSRADEITEYVYKKFTNSEYYDGMVDTIFMISDTYDTKDELENFSEMEYMTSEEKNNLQTFFFISFVAGLIVALIFYFNNKSKCNMAVISNEAKAYINVKGINMTNDILVNTMHTSHVISSGGSGGGGHSGGSGISHSGGGHSF